MKMKLALSAFAMLALTVGAHAADGTQPEISGSADEVSVSNRKLFEFNFKCEFEKNGDMRDDADARAFAKVFAWVNHGDWSKDMEVNNAYQNLLAVTVHGELKYANGALLNSRERFVEISGIHGSPSIFVKRNHSDVLSKDWMYYKAALKIHGRFLKGACYVKAEPVHHTNDVTLN